MSGQVPSVRVQLVQSVKLPPNHSVVVEAKLVGDTKFPPGPMLMEGTDRLKEMGLQLVDEFIQLPDITTNTGCPYQLLGNYPTSGRRYRSWSCLTC